VVVVVLALAENLKMWNRTRQWTSVETVGNR